MFVNESHVQFSTVHKEQKTDRKKANERGKGKVLIAAN